MVLREWCALSGLVKGDWCKVMGGWLLRVAGHILGAATGAQVGAVAPGCVLYERTGVASKSARREVHNGGGL